MARNVIMYPYEIGDATTSLEFEGIWRTATKKFVHILSLCLPSFKSFLIIYEKKMKWKIPHIWSTICFDTQNSEQGRVVPFLDFSQCASTVLLLQTFESNGKLNQVSIIIYSFWGSLQDPHKILAGSLRIFSPTFAKWRSPKILIVKDLFQVFTDL